MNTNDYKDWMEKWEASKEKTISPADLNAYFEQKEMMGRGLVVMDIGPCDLPSGKILVCDPLISLFDKDERPYFLTAPAGTYRTEICLLDVYEGSYRPAAVRVRFSDKRAAHFYLALLGGENIEGLEPGESFCGFPVDSGLGCICDATLHQTLCGWDEDNQRIYDDYLEELMEESYRRYPAYQPSSGSWANWQVPGTSSHIPVFSTGFGDGEYPAYWGFDEDGVICQLVIHFIDIELSAEAEKEASNQASNEDGYLMLPGDIPLDLVRVKAGSFMMGSPVDEKERSKNELQHQVTLTEDYYIGKYPVTQAQWEAIMGYNPSTFKGANRPVENVSWHQIQVFLDAIKLPQGRLTLPTEAQWEYAARGGHKNSGYQVYAGSDDIDQVAWYARNSGGETHDVGQKRPNALGLYDMSGNVEEWCADGAYRKYTEVAVTNPVGPQDTGTCATRGGNWDSETEQCRSASRWDLGPEDSENTIGFRVAVVLS